MAVPLRGPPGAARDVMNPPHYRASGRTVRFGTSAGCSAVLRRSARAAIGRGRRSGWSVADIGAQRPPGALRRALVPLAMAQFICSFAGSNLNVMINDISKDLNTTV